MNTRLKTPHELVINNLSAGIAEKEILHGVSLKLCSGEIHAVMGPNGSGKSTLANVLAGNPTYTVTNGTILIDGENVLEMSVDQRSRAGLFLAFQYPSEVDGVNVQSFLKAAYDQHIGEQNPPFPSVLAFREHVRTLSTELGLKKELLSRGLNEGFSGGEKKRLEILQLALLKPKFAILDETDSGLDIDAIKAVASGVNAIVEKHAPAVMIITHYQRILSYIHPTHVHVMRAGNIVREGNGELIDEIEAHGYERI